MISNMVWCKVEKLAVLIYLWLWWSTSIHVKAANESLRPGDTLNSTSTLYSKNGKYYMLFDLAEEDYYYLFIRGTNGYDVWFSDRNQPVDFDSAVLSLNHSGVLEIESKLGKPIILYSPPNFSAITNNTVATLLDSGNFMLQQLHPNGTKRIVLWQSFDYPTDMLIPTMKLGVNHKTGHNWSLVSSLTDLLYFPGAFSLEWEPKLRELIIKRRGKVCWRSGKLRNNRFEHIPEEIQRMYEYTIVSNRDEDSFSFKIKTPNKAYFSRWKLLETGRLISDEGDIARADMCYGYNNTEGGCQRWEDIPTCREPGDVFQRKIGRVDCDDTIIDLTPGYVDSDCKAMCWSNCSCTGYTNYYPNGTGCVLYGCPVEDNIFDDSGDELYMLVRIDPHKGTKRRWIRISAVIAAALLVICAFMLCLTLQKRKYWLKGKKSKSMETELQDLDASNGSSGIKDFEDDLKKGHDIEVFNYASVLTATSDFSPENKLGQGGFGPVYKGVLPTGQEVAVKRLSKNSGQGIVEFKNELTLICELQHMNLVQLLGCCIHKEERILIYEYMPNKSLDFYLFDCTRSKFLDWKKRFNIIEGISQGLLYLHKYSRLKVIHRDLKASNILLDENMNPKISDFGMARIFTPETTINTNRIVGTYGYMSPEYAMEGICSTKSDVYSFGVLMLEIVSGRRNNSFYDADRPLNLVGRAWELWNEGVWQQLMDQSLNDTFVPDEVQRCIHVGLLCVQQDANDRPTMSEVISTLTNKITIDTLPRRPAFYVGREILEGTSSSKVSNTDFMKETFTSSEVETKCSTLSEVKSSS